MRRVYFGADNIITSLGFNTVENADNMMQGRIGIRTVNDPVLYPGPVPCSMIDDELFCHRFTDYLGAEWNRFTRLERLFIASIRDTLGTSGVDPSDPATLFILSSTKGNIDLLEPGKREDHEPDRVHLWRMAEVISTHFSNPNKPLIICNACISGSVAIMAAARLIASGRYDHAIVTGGDIVSGFVVSGFMSFQALSPGPCRPFDANRAGLTLGEGCGTLILTADPAKAGIAAPAIYLGGATSNDANHISGPSRDGEGLFLAVAVAMKEAGVTPGEIDFISAHGTATPYNDEMESLALARAGLDNVAVNSFKGCIGHTLGAAGIIETILSLWSMQNSMLIQSAGYAENGVSKPLNVITRNTSRPIGRFLKTASGFGGCNAALVLGR